jgi:putative Holliday junction resolvase
VAHVPPDDSPGDSPGDSLDVPPGDSPAAARHLARPGVRLGIDVGSVRVGVAASDPAASLATPVETLRRPADATKRSDLARIAALVAERGAVEVVVGLPLSLSGARGAAAHTAFAYAQEVASVVSPVPVRVVDERLSTVTAHGQLQAAGVRSRAGRAVVDQAAAVVILQSALDGERSTGVAPGEIVVPE